MDVFAWRANASRRLTTALVAVGSLLTVGCASERAATAPVIPGNGPVAQFRPLAFTADVNIRTGKVVITAPTTATRTGPTLAVGGAESPNLSLLGGEAVRLVPRNYTASAVGAFVPNKIRVTFEVSVENKLPGVKFITPTWPTPPAAGVILFPLDYAVTTTPGGVTGTDGNEVIVEQPSYGGIEPSIDWNGTRTTGSGAPFNFFNDAVCVAGPTSDCFRWEAFDLEIAPLGASAYQTVGFDIDASVAQFRTRMIVAADLAPGTAVPPGSITGTVSSPARGVLEGVTVTPSSGLAATTAADGSFAIADVPVGSRTVTLSNLPAGCTGTYSQTVGVNTAAATVVTFNNVTCTGNPGTITGVLRSNQGNTPIAGATVSASNGGGTPVTAVTSATGSFSLASVASGTGSLTVTAGLPAGCTVAPAAYTLTSGGSQAVDITASCPVVVAAGYQYNTTWTSLSATQVAVDIRVDMRTFNRADIADYEETGFSPSVIGDPLTGAQFVVNYDATKLTYASRNVSPFPVNLGTPTVNGTTPGVVSVLAGGADLFGGNVGIVRIVFNRVAGATGTVGTTTTFTAFSSRTAAPPAGATVSILANVVNTEGTFVLP